MVPRRVGIGGTKARTVKGQQSIDYETGQRKHWQQPHKLGQSSVQWMTSCAGFQRRLEEDHPRSRLMSLRLIVRRCRKMAMMIARPTAASAAEMVITKTTN